MQLRGLTAIISGASLGLGFEIAQQFIQEGANIMICARDAEPLKKATEALQKIASHKNQVQALVTDIARESDVEALVTATLKAFGKIDILVANAGVYGPKGPIDVLDWQAWSDAIDINLKGTVLQCKAVIPHFKKQAQGKIIILSGGGASKPLPYLSAYAASKAGVVRFAETLAEEVRKDHIDVNTVAPGALNTRLLTEILEAGPEKVGKTFYEEALKQKNSGGTSLEKGAKLCVYLAGNQSNGITGKLISAVWDPWQQFDAFKQALDQSDIYTLRRITPKDRGQSWGDA